MEEGRPAGPYVLIRLRYWVPPTFGLGAEPGGELLRRLEQTGQTGLAQRIEGATRSEGEPKFVVGPGDEPLLLAALEAPPELVPGALAELRDALRQLAEQSSAV